MYKINLFEGIRGDLKRRLPLYWSDWREGLQTKVLASIIFMFFCSILPSITFAADLSKSTENNYGVVEVILSTAMGGVIFAIFAGQPLVIMGVTGPVSIFSATVFDICKQLDVAFLPFMAWASIWATLFHVILAICNSCNFLKYITKFSCEIFGCLIAVIYVVKAVQEIVSYFTGGPMAQALLSLLLALGTFYVATNLASARKWTLFKKGIRGIIADYAAAFAIVLFTALPYLPKLTNLEIARLPVPDTFQTTTGRPWLVPFWELPLWAVFASILPAIVLTVLFFFDHNVSSLLSQRPEFHLRKGPAFHFDFLMLGICTLISGILGIPAPNGLIPQAPLHVRSLSKIKRSEDKGIEFVDHVCEQRVSGLFQSLLIGLTLLPPILHVLGLIPRAVLAGLFLYMGLESFVDNTLANRVKLIFTDKKLTPPLWATVSVPYKVVAKFTIVQVLLLALIFYITESPAAISFPVFILLLVPVKQFVLPKLFEKSHLDVLDEPAVIMTPGAASGSSTMTVNSNLGNNIKLEELTSEDEIKEKLSDSETAEARHELHAFEDRTGKMRTRRLSRVSMDAKPNKD
ncbi:hypothetical protein K493DRAFT_317201 [Basidiobolus meristosporus CBS 931.73]|uniref:Bicarbonate transporter-like transmembrane domain-containing protein n=1 Tax=Basidiobolus meristosporus CBS 931.73 TaxID=1314790 RepID=A0A1Y1Y0K8_9FUNG|nr:hypothetical protein K493DRAFT_317201 [Basidiobolus meristosporus CBS 931.73]|eukprot:ORX91537.1 hypothetical protein K493DRAFT_317201 [Basidiobolus meristosporus CBS 931.73]